MPSEAHLRIDDMRALGWSEAQLSPEAGHSRHGQHLRHAEHELLREQVARFIAREVEPHALAWEDAGLTPRAVLRSSATQASSA